MILLFFVKKTRQWIPGNNSKSFICITTVLHFRTSRICQASHRCFWQLFQFAVSWSSVIVEKSVSISLVSTLDPKPACQDVHRRHYALFWV